MKPVFLIVLCAALGFSSWAPAQFVNEAGDVKLLVPKSPMVKGPVTKLLLLGSKEAESTMVLEELKNELSRQTTFTVVLPQAGSPLAAGTDALEPLPKEQRERLAATYGASHVMWVRLERFSFKEKSSMEVMRGTRFYKWLGSATGMLHCPVMDLGTGALTAPAPQNLQKQYNKEREHMEIVPETAANARHDLVVLAARRALQMVVPVQAVQVLPFMTQGALDHSLDLLKAGKLDEALDATTKLAAASAGESAKYRSRIQYDLALLLCLKNRPQEAQTSLLAAQKLGFDKPEVEKALEACNAILAAAKP